MPKIVGVICRGVLIGAMLYASLIYLAKWGVSINLFTIFVSVTFCFLIFWGSLVSVETQLTPKARGKLLGRLLQELARRRDRWIPGPAYKPFHQLCTWGAGEVLVVDPKKKGRVLLRYRSDDPWDGWQVMGGYIKPLESVQEFCNRTVQEDAGLGEVKVVGVLATSKWLNHPFSFPLCVLLLCYPVGEVVEREDLRWFEIGDLPFNKMQHPRHRDYLEAYLAYLKNPDKICPILGE